jgi:hypothetical protein
MLQCKLPKAKYVALGVMWFLSLVLWVALSITQVNLHAIITPPEFRETMVSPDHVGRFELMRYNPDQNGKLSFCLSFDSLSTENGNLGMFKTSLQRTLRINELKVGVYGYNSAEPEILLGLEDTSDAKEVVKYGIGKFSRIFYEEDENSTCKIRPAVDFNNIAKLFVVDFQFTRYRNDVLGLEVTSKIAETVYDQSGLVLKGHVVIKTSDGDVLECNRVIWDVKNQNFNAKSGYAFRQNGITKVGKEICLDMNLNEVAISQNKSNDRKELQKCYAKSQ